MYHAVSTMIGLDVYYYTSITLTVDQVHSCLLLQQYVPNTGMYKMQQNAHGLVRVGLD